MEQTELEKAAEKSLFPLTSEWIAEFKKDWYADNKIMGKKYLDEKWAEQERLFYMVYKYQRTTYDKKFKEWQQSQQDWISVEDRLPEEHLLVMVYDPKAVEDIYIDAYVGKNAGWDYGEHNVTHWMPLPSPPKQ